MEHQVRIAAAICNTAAVEPVKALAEVLGWGEVSDWGI